MSLNSYIFGEILEATSKMLALLLTLTCLTSVSYKYISEIWIYDIFSRSAALEWRVPLLVQDVQVVLRKIDKTRFT